MEWKQERVEWKQEQVKWKQEQGGVEAGAGVATEAS